jgi:RHS repeat-associated protein
MLIDFKSQPGPTALPLNIDEPLAMLRSGTTSFYQADGLGSLTSLSNGSGALANTYTYDSFGNLTASSGSITNSLRYTGREWDGETGLYYYRARYYDSSVGRFISEDPLSFGAGIDFYSYVKNNPVRTFDPSGLADVYIWPYTGSGPNDNWGHAALVLNDGTVISWWPGEPRDMKIPDIYSAPALPPDLARDQDEEGSRPMIIRLDNLDEAAIKNWWRKFRRSHKWKTLTQNCSTTVAEALDAGGGRNRAPLASHHFVWTPADVEDYAKQIQRAGQGQYIPFILPQPGYH